jgi:hypothetical protein
MDENELKTALDALKTDRAKYDLVFAFADTGNITLALKNIGHSRSWFYTLPDEEQQRLIQIAGELHANAKMRARQIIEEAIIEAAEVKAAGLRSRQENIRQASATEILDRNLGKPNQPITGKDGGALVIEVKEHD